jgi:RHS repeat-associated protein
MNRTFLLLLSAVIGLFAVTVVMACPPPPPTAILQISPNYILAGGLTLLDGHNSVAGNGRTITKYEWDFDGNGTYDYNETPGDGMVTHTYSTPGTYIARLRVTNNVGYPDVTTATVYVGSETTYNYDTLSNRTSVVGGTTVSYSQNNANINQYGSVGGVNYSYSDNGNLTNDGTYTYGYDKRNRLTSVNNGSIASYKYDSAGRRISKTVGSTTTKFFYDGDRIAFEYTGTGTTGKKKYVYGNGIDEVLCMIDVSNSQTYYYQADALGSIVALTNSSGAVVERYKYDVYGKPTIYNAAMTQTYSSSQYGNRFMFTGREYDAETGLYYYRARHYNATIGRFLQIDPLGVVANRSSRSRLVTMQQYKDSLNLYEYVQSCPINKVDPFGLCECPPGTLSEWNTPGINMAWSSEDAWLHYYFGHGETKEFSARSWFSARVKSGISGLNKQLTPELRKRAKSIAENVSSNRCIPLGFSGSLTHYAYSSGTDLLVGTIGSGGEPRENRPLDTTSSVEYRATCCFKKPCCRNGVANVDVKCKVEVTISDLYGFHDVFSRNMANGTNFWTIVHFFDDFNDNISVHCK